MNTSNGFNCETPKVLQVVVRRQPTIITPHQPCSLPLPPFAEDAQTPTKFSLNTPTCFLRQHSELRIKFNVETRKTGLSKRKNNFRVVLFIWKRNSCFLLADFSAFVVSPTPATSAGWYFRSKMPEQFAGYAKLPLLEPSELLLSKASNLSRPYLHHTSVICGDHYWQAVTLVGVDGQPKQEESRELGHSHYTGQGRTRYV